MIVRLYELCCFHGISLEADESLSDSDNEPPSKKGRHKITDPMKNNKKLENTGKRISGFNFSDSAMID